MSADAPYIVARGRKGERTSQPALSQTRLLYIIDHDRVFTGKGEGSGIQDDSCGQGMTVLLAGVFCCSDKICLLSLA